MVFGCQPRVASAHYDPQVGRFLQRDPVGVSDWMSWLDYELDGPFRIEGTDVGAHYLEGMHLYEYARSLPSSVADPSGHRGIPPLITVFQELRCCTCLTYAEAGADKDDPCKEAVAHMMINRQRWNGKPGFRGEGGFCEQARQKGKFAGGLGNRNFDACMKCPPTGNSRDIAAMGRSLDACVSALGGGKDPTGGAQFWWSRGRTPEWMIEQEDGGNCSRVRVPGCSLDIWKCKKPPVK